MRDANEATDNDVASLSDGVSRAGLVPLTWRTLKRAWTHLMPVTCCACARPTGVFVAVRDQHPSYSSVLAIWHCVHEGCGTTMASPTDRKVIREVLIESGARPLWRVRTPAA